MAERAAKQLELNKSELPNSITEVIATLSRAGFDAYIVGGGVRDTLLGLRPKDFDAVTDAKPHEIKDVFGKRCRIIGRRFQLAHVYSGRELIEVATFRGPPNNNANTNQDGMILRDNVWGDIKQDFARRDFSINALYYQPLKGVVHDFCGALKDIDNKVIRLLGHAPVRIEEDPVRLLRALRFKAKLGFEFDKELSEQFHDSNWALLEQISPHRLYDETQKMFTGGYLVPLLPLLFESGAIDSLIIYPPSEPSALVQQVAINTDKRIAAGKSINPAFFYAALLWENYLHQLEKAKKRNMPFAEAQMHAAGKVIDRQRIKTAIPKFAEQFIRDIWILQPKLAAPRSKQIEQLAEHPRFRAGFDFLLLREQCGDAEHPLSESTNGMGEWWQTYQTLSAKDQQQAIDDFDENIRRGAYKRGRERNRQKQVTSSKDTDASLAQAKQENGKENATKQSSTQKGDSAQQAAQTPNDAATVPSKRRRRSSGSSEPTKTQSSTDSKSYDSKQVQQDRAELEQLKQLSLANTENNADIRHTAKPLFVIEHERVVPPLQKQQADDKKSPSKAQQTAAEPTHDVQSQSAAGSTTKSETKNQRQQGQDRSAESKPQTTKSEMPKQVPSDHELTTEKPVADKKAKRKMDGAAQVPRTPQLVSPSSAPVPSKRRRRQPVVDSVEAPVSADNSSPDKRTTDSKYTKKSPKTTVQADTDEKGDNGATKKESTTTAKTKKSVQSSKDKTNQAQADSSAVTAQGVNYKSPDSKGPDSKGPIPSKRRRRQLSTDSAQS
ncbi:polynucleotide adenylyltransferase PcnB [uncultured Psychrobacter sp.]|uniref:polynucleotide adenylyltransferase PcnB n=1 Tax=uncultured Psychrobacter sp. TaxID=259303 RepID=UPI003459C064